MVVAPTKQAPIAGYCACAASGQALATPPTSVMSSRRLPSRATSGMKRISQFWNENLVIRYTQAECCYVRFGSKADIAVRLRNVRYVPNSGH
jgi:hypothetical protein